MELYKIIATCANYTGTGNPRTLTDIPENFQGVKISQDFSFINPIGYTPSYSIETMRVIQGDKDWIDNIWLTYGPNSFVSFAIYKLNATNTAYELLSAFNVDFKTDTFNKQDSYTEFPLKSDSCVDQYNEIKNAPRNFSAPNVASLPTTQKLVNYVSVKKDTGVTNEDNTGYLTLIENQDSKVFNSDTAITDDLGRNAYEFQRGGPGTTNIAVSARGELLVTHTITGSTTLHVKLYKDYANPVVTLASIAATGLSTTIPIDFLQAKIADLVFAVNGVLFVGVELEDAGATINDIAGDFAMELFVETELPANTYNRSINYITAEAVLRSIFNNRATVDASMLDIGITSSQSIIKGNAYLSIIPKDFLSDLCAAAGLIVNFKNDGTVKIDKILTYFNALLDDANAILLTDFKEVQISPDTGLNFSSVTVGMEQKEYETYTYFNDWNKVLTFQQIGRSASESLNLQLAKYRVDFSGILDYIAKYNPVSTDTSNDLFLIAPAFGGRTTDEGEIYDPFTPRDMLENWRKFLEFCFYNYSLDTLELVSSSGDDFNLDIYGVQQFDDFVFTGDGTRLLPIKIRLKTPLGSTDFTEHILKIPNESYLPESFGDYLYIFVTKSETTDQIEEQEITGNLIKFQPT